MEPVTHTDVVYSAYTFRTQPDSFALMVVVDGFPDPEEAQSHLEALMPLLMMDASGTVH